MTQIALPSSDRVRDLATLSADMDQKVFKSRSAIVAPDDYAYGLGRMYQTYRELDRESTKEIGVFRTMEEALAFLQIDRPVFLPEPV